MEIRIAVPEALLNRPNADTKQIQTMLTRMLILELYRQGAASREQAAIAADLTPEEFDALNETVKFPATVYRNASRTDFYATEKNTPQKRNLAPLVVLAGLIVAVAAGAFLFNGRISAHLYINKGKALLMKGNKTGAADSFKKALKADPRNETANAELGAYYIEAADNALRNGRKSRAKLLFKTAILYLSKSIEANPANPQALYDIGYASEMLGDVQAAKGHYKKALETDPGYTSAELRLDNLERRSKTPAKPN